MGINEILTAENCKASRRELQRNHTLLTLRYFSPSQRTLRLNLSVFKILN